MKVQILTEIFYIKLITNKNIQFQMLFFLLLCTCKFSYPVKSIYKLKLQYLSQCFITLLATKWGGTYILQ